MAAAGEDASGGRSEAGGAEEAVGIIDSRPGLDDPGDGADGD
jgi:hypothetical protein